ncbi:hypothetical protein EJF36_20570 [Bacillus sp. HMF5848]|uniref:DUF6773 family protein n=1 Tax=Bacillus sp. HMF5848 TaxID=2495421 RepID=UPI000F795358|nr:DUF6773 family protein [Bacillus sp. HMF5848]RSK29083.1 hypothetical protein EJF36_20570 [Bacillus sp. HMF5848]
MKLFQRRNQNIKDERIENLKNKVYREMFTVVTIICGFSMALKLFFIGLHANVTTEILVLILPGLYYLLRITKLGIYSEEIEMHDQKSKLSISVKNIVYALAIGIVLGVGFGLRAAIMDASTTGEAVYYFVLVFVATLMIYVPIIAFTATLIHVAAKRKSEQMINENLEDQDKKW